MDPDRLAYLLAVLASLTGLGAIAAVWPRQRQDQARRRHPSTTPPLWFDVATDIEGSAHWQVTARSATATIALEIVTFKPAGSELEWTSEPLVEPIVLEPGESVVLPSVLPDSSIAYDIVAAWTTRHSSGDTQGSRTLTVHPPTATANVGAKAADDRRPFQLLLGLLAPVLLVIGLVAAFQFSDGSTSAPTAAPAPDRPDDVSLRSSSTSASPNTAAPTTSPSSMPMTTPTTVVDDRATTPPTTSPSPGTTPGTTTPGTTTPGTTATTTTTTTATTAPAARRIDALGRIEDCRFGTDCLVVGFTVVGLPDAGDYVCEFDDGERFTFSYIDGGGEVACSSSGADAAITIDIDGVRSATITRDDLNDG